jgi:NADPH:quinone reductase-like Zn-dependent oxidoreductase
MKAYRLQRKGERSWLERFDAAEPEPSPTQVAVRVRATSVNPRDLMLLDGTYVLPTRDGVIPLCDGAGEVVAVGARVTRAKVGDRVTPGKKRRR